jgi:DNA-binding SARP family transcriptional activator
MIELRVLGTVTLEGLDQAAVERLLAQPKPVALLAYLAIATPHGLHRRDRLSGFFWPELDQEHARSALRKGIHEIRRTLGGEALLARGDEEIGLDETAVWCDASAFDRAIPAGKYARALELYGGDLLPSFFLPGADEFEQWLETERARFRTLAGSAAWRAAEALEKDEQPTGAGAWARRAIELAPYDERVLRKMLALLDRLGDRAGAVAAYEGFRRQLVAAYGVEPSPETVSLVEAIRARRTSRPAP